MFNPDPNFLHAGSRICIREFKYFNLKKWFLSSRKYDSGCLSRIRIPDPDPDFLVLTHSGSRGQKVTGSRIRIRNTAASKNIPEISEEPCSGTLGPARPGSCPRSP